MSSASAHASVSFTAYPSLADIAPHVEARASRRRGACSETKGLHIAGVQCRSTPVEAVSNDSPLGLSSLYLEIPGRSSDAAELAAHLA
jgi:hypothetical protein